MQYKRCSRCRNMRNDFTDTHRCCDRCLAQSSEYQHKNLENSKERRAAWTINYMSTEKGKESARATSERMRAKHPFKVQARQLMENARRKGEITRQPCEVCGDTVVEGHHPDYSYPLNVVWLCKLHHVEVENVRV